MDNRVRDWSQKNKTVRPLYEIQKEIEEISNALGEPSKLKADIDSIKQIIKSPRYYGVESGTTQTWYDGIDIPASELGIDGDYFLQIDTWDIWKKQFGYWERIGNIQGGEGPMGATGLPGMNGANGLDGSDGMNGLDGMNGRDGSVWYDGNERPSPEVGMNGDYFLDISNGDIYKKYINWERIGNIMGIQGIQGEIGPEPSIDHLNTAVDEKIQEVEQRIEAADTVIKDVNDLKTDFEAFATTAKQEESIRVQQEIDREKYVNSLMVGLSVLQSDINEILTGI